MHRFPSEVDSKTISESYERFLLKNKKVKKEDHAKRDHEFEKIMKWASEVTSERQILEWVLEEKLNIGSIQGQIVFQ